MFWIRSVWLVLCLAWLALTAIACASNRTTTTTPALLVIASATPIEIVLPTTTCSSPLSQNTPTEQIKSPTATPHACIGWDEVRPLIGTTQCVRGNVFRTYSNGRAFFIDFDNTHRAFFGTSLTTHWEISEGDCVELYGTLLDWQGRPDIVLEKDDVRLCDSPLLPYSVALSQAIPSATRAPATIRTTRVVPTQAQPTIGRGKNGAFRKGHQRNGQVWTLAGLCVCWRNFCECGIGAARIRASGDVSARCEICGLVFAIPARGA